MGITIGGAISRVRNDFRLVHADARVTNKYIYALLDDRAAKAIKEESDKKRLTKIDAIWQTLDCQELIDVPTTDDCCKFQSNCTIKRTKDKIPFLYEDSSGVLIRSVTSIDYSQELQPIKLSEWLRKKEINNKFDKTLYFFYRNGYLYFPNLNWKLITVSGLFKDNVDKYNKCDGEDTDPVCTSKLDDKWPVPEYIQSGVIDYVIRELASTIAQIPPHQEEEINKSSQ